MAEFAYNEKTGKPLTMFGITLDITEYRDTETSINNNKKLCRYLMKNAPLPIIINMVANEWI
jgi:hypothetical protein